MNQPLSILKFNKGVDLFKLNNTKKMFLFAPQRFIKCGFSYIKNSYANNSYKSYNNLSKLNTNKSAFKLQQWNELLASCPVNQKMLIGSIVNNENNRSKILEVTTILNYQQGKKISTYSTALLTIALNGSQKPIFFSNASKSLELFLFQFSFEPNDYPIFNDKISNKLKEKVITQLTKILFTIEKEGGYGEKVKRSIKNKAFMVKFLKKVGNHVQSYESLMEIFNFFSSLEDQKFPIDRFRFSPLVQQADKKLQELYQKDPLIFEIIENNNQKSLKARYMEMVKIFKVINYFQIQNENSVQFYLNVIFQQKYIEKQTNKKALLQFLLKIYRFSATYLDKDEKNPILSKIKKEFKEDEAFRRLFFGIPQNTIGSFLALIIKTQLYHKYLKIPHQIIQQCIVINQRQTKPELDQIIIQLLSMNTKIKLNETFHHLYPQHLSKQFENKDQDKDEEAINNDNEFSIRMKIALNNLGIKYEMEKNVSGRIVDFFLEDNIVIECDGDFHIDYKTFNISVNTATRNFSLILNEYKVLVFGIEQLNKNRYIKSLEELVKKKLRIMKDHNAFLVQ